MIVAVTGHRPDKLGGYSQATLNKLVALAESELKRLDALTVITGMALGWDQAVAVAASNLGIPFLASVPFDGQESRWPSSSQAFYKDVLSRAKAVVVVNPGTYQAWKMQARNVYMVDRCDKLLAMWNGTSGGTANCVRYAESVGKPIVNCWEQWK